jgi:hypothetical protein
MPVSAGRVKIVLQIVPGPNQPSLDSPLNLPPLIAHFTVGNDYRIRASKVSENLFSYWIEDVKTGLKISAPHFYNPSTATKNAVVTADIISEVPDLLLIDQGVSGDEICPVLIRRTKATHFGPKQVAGIAFMIVYVPLVILGGEAPGSVEPYAIPRYDYEGLQSPCFRALPGHHYVLKAAEMGYDPVDSSRRKRPAFGKVQLWDTTDEQVVSEYATKRLERVFMLEQEWR